MKKTTFTGLIIFILHIFVLQTYAQDLNTTVDITWTFDQGTSTQTAAYTAGTESYFNPDYFTVGSNLKLLDKNTTNSISYTRFQPISTASVASDADAVIFGFRPKKGLSFKPTVVSFNAMRYGTDGGSIDVVWVAADGSSTSLGTAIKPIRNNNTVDSPLNTIDLSTFNIPANAGEGKIKIIIYSLGNTKQAGISNIKVTGQLTGSVISVPAYTFSTSVSPANAGTVSQSIVGNSFDAGTEITVAANRNFGYKFVRWENASGQTVSSEPIYKLTLNENTALTAVFETITTYNFTVNKAGSGADWGALSISPSPTNGKFETGTVVTVTAESNKVSNFLYWEDNTTSLARTITVDADKTLTANYDQIPFIVGWDLKVQTPSSSRPGDFYSELSNAGTFGLYNADGSSAGWLPSTGAFSPSLPCARMWTPVANFATPRYYQATFSTVGYKNIQVKSLVGASYHAYPVVTMQYSTNGTTFTELNRVDITSTYNAAWADLNGVLPDTLNGKAKVYIRWIADTNSTPTLGNATDVDGTAITNIYVYADVDAVNDVIAPNLISAIPAEGSAYASANGAIVLTFNERLKAGAGNCTLGSSALTPVFGSRTVTFAYSKLSYNTDYTFTVPAGALTDMSGNVYAGLVLNFKTMNRPIPMARLYDAVVAKDGSGDFSSIQAAINAMPVGRTAPWLVFVKNGRYEELINIPANKPFLHLIGQDKNKVTLTYKCYSTSTRIVEDTEGYSGATGEQTNTGSVLYSQASDFYAENISFENRWGVEKLAGPQALSLKTMADKFAFYNCNMRSFQDTWQTTSTDNQRHYANKCLIEGAVDYIYNNGNVLIENTTIYNLRKGSVIVAPSHNTSTTWGYVFRDCVIDGNAAAMEGGNAFGRPWHNAPQAVFINTKVLTPMSTEAWINMGAIPKIFAEYNSFNASGQQFDLSGRKKTYSYTNSTTGLVVTGDVQKNVLTDVEAAQYTYENVVMATDGWNPRAYFEPVSKPTNLQTNSRTISWNASDYAISYVVLRNDSVIGFTKELNFTDNLAMNNTNYQYAIKAVNEYGSLSETSEGLNVLFTGFNDVSFQKPVIHTTKNHELLISNIKEGTKISIYSSDGKKIFSDTAYSDEYKHSFSQLKGVFVLKLAENSYKIIF